MQCHPDTQLPNLIHAPSPSLLWRTCCLLSLESLESLVGTPLVPSESLYLPSHYREP
jgi:hypothetical protein